jgi:acetolactate synthase-1/2/3 large subunit
VTTSGAHGELAELAEMLQAPVLTTNMGKGAIPADHPLHLGYLSGQLPVRDYLARCDLLVAVGTRFSFITTDRWALPLPRPIVHIDIDPEEIDKNYPAAVGVVGDAAAALRAIIRQLQQGDDPAPRLSRTGEVAALKAEVRAIWEADMPVEHALVTDIRAALPREAIVSMDPTVCAYAAWSMLDVYEPRSYLYPMGGATLGYGFPAALGAKVAHPGRPVVAICGDAGFMVSCQALATAVQYGINVVLLLFNDEGYGVLRIQQDRHFGRRSQVDTVNPDFAAMAHAFGADGVRVKGPGQVKAALEAGLENDKPTLIEIPVALSVQTITA